MRRTHYAALLPRALHALAVLRVLHALRVLAFLRVVAIVRDLRAICSVGMCVLRPPVVVLRDTARRSLTRPGRGVAVHRGCTVGHQGVHARGALELRWRRPRRLGRDGILERLRDIQLGEFLRGWKAVISVRTRSAAHVAWTDRFVVMINLRYEKDHVRRAASAVLLTPPCWRTHLRTTGSPQYPLTTICELVKQYMKRARGRTNRARAESPVLRRPCRRRCWFVCGGEHGARRSPARTVRLSRSRTSCRAVPERHTRSRANSGMAIKAPEAARARPLLVTCAHTKERRSASLPCTKI